MLVGKGNVFPLRQGNYDHVTFQTMIIFRLCWANVFIWKALHRLDRIFCSNQPGSGLAGKTFFHVNAFANVNAFAIDLLRFQLYEVLLSAGKCGGSFLHITRAYGRVVNRD